MKFSFAPASLLSGLASVAFFAAAGHASAVVIAGYDFSSGSVSNANLFSASAANIAAAQPGVTPSNFTTLGSSAASQTSISISTATNTAYIQGSYTPVAGSIYSGSRYFTFNVSLSSAYNLGSLTFQYGGTNTSGATANTVFGAQIQVGSGAFVNLPTSSVATIPNGTSTYTQFGTYNADLSAYQNVTDTVTVRIFVADDATDNAASARIKNVALNADLVPEPATAASLLFGLGALALRRRRHA